MQTGNWEQFDGQRMNRFLQAGTREVVAQRDAINRINVFPVPDGDTGSNLSNTLLAVTRSLLPHTESSLDRTLRKAADAAIDSAHGNAGTIFAQFLHGFAQAVQGAATLDLGRFGDAAIRGAEAAYAALGSPKEGTILSVLRDWAHSLSGLAKSTRDFRQAFGRALDTARTSLAGTTGQLEVLAQHQVVDAGALGFVSFLEGVDAGLLRGLDLGEFDQWLSTEAAGRDSSLSTIEHQSHGGRRYCCNLLLEGGGLACEGLRQEMKSEEDSLVMAGGGQRLRIHLHTDEPAPILRRLAQHCFIRSARIDDMFAQQGLASPAALALVSDSTCELPETESLAGRLYRVPLKVSVDQASYLDGVSMPPAAFYQHMARAHSLPSTSQPSKGDFLQLYKALLKKDEAIVSVHLAEAISGTVQVARAAAQEVAPGRIHVIDGRQVSVGLGLLLRGAFAAREQGMKAPELAAWLEDRREYIRVWGTTPSLQHAVRGGRVDARVARAAELLGIKPIIEFDEEGKPYKAGMKLGFSRAQRDMLARGLRFAGGQVRDALVVHADNPQEGQSLARMAEQHFGLAQVDVVEAGAVLGSHVGPGAVALAVERA